jgi:proteasome activator subunit 4
MLKTLDRFVPLCVREIRSELDNGAASTPSTSTASHGDTDTALQWYSYLLGGALSHFRAEGVERHGQAVFELIKDMAERCKSERGYTHAARLMSFAFTTPINYFPIDARSLNAAEFEAESAPSAPSRYDRH